nr:transcriptional regulator [Arthrobacter sp. zg-Y20]
MSPGRPVPSLLREPVRESWQRSLGYSRNPDVDTPVLAFEPEELREYRKVHPLHVVMPVIQRLLVQPAADSGLLVAVGDQHGRLLWVEGDEDLRRRAEGMYFMPGTDWSEPSIGTSAPGAALAGGTGIQIAGAEHFNRRVHSFNCTAVPVRDPDSGTVIGVVDITGGVAAVAPHTLSLIEAAVDAAQSHLRIERLEARERSRSGRRLRRLETVRAGLYRDSLQILGRDHALLNVGGASLQLSGRHAELLTLLALNPQGLTADELAAMAYPETAAPATVRAEMLRLRAMLARFADGPQGLVPQSRPYRLPRELVVDARQVLSYLEHGAHRLALNIYAGPVLPRSEAPAVSGLRAEVSSVLRETMLSDASPDLLAQYLKLEEAEDDVEGWAVLLRLLPPDSPRRAAVVARLERLDRELGLNREPGLNRERGVPRPGPLGVRSWGRAAGSSAARQYQART